jgi:5-methylcytosine-specific restriction endonuclease McrA
MQHVFVLSTDRQPLDPCHPARARQLLRAGKAAIWRRFPFTIILKERTAIESVTHAHMVKLDPGSQTSGVAVVNERYEVVWGAELTHKSDQVAERLQERRALRRSRRNRHTRYRPARFSNRRRPAGWLTPSMRSRVENTATWVARLRRLCPVSGLALELVKFDTQQMDQPEISGVEYQQGELAGYEVRAYLLEKWGRKCAYGGETGVPLEVEHITPRSRGGSDRVSNLTLACHACNQAKGNRTAAEFGHPEVQAQTRQPLKDAAAMNATRWALFRQLQATGLPVECGTGGRTAFNRARLQLPKAHWIDAACVGDSGAVVQVDLALKPLLIRAVGRGTRKMCRTDKFGFPVVHRTARKQFLGWRTGDLARAVIPSGKYQGTHTGRVTIRNRPCFRLNGVDVHPKYLTRLQKGDGYSYGC